MDYGKLKTLLREDGVAATGDGDGADDEPWTGDDETRFCEEMFNVQLVKVSRFQAETFRSIKERIDACFARLRDMAPVASPEEGDSSGVGGCGR